MEDSFNEEGHNVPKNQNPSNEVHLSYDIQRSKWTDHVRTVYRNTYINTHC